MDWPAGNARQTVKGKGVREQGRTKEGGRDSAQSEVSLSRFICRRRRLTHVK